MIDKLELNKQSLAIIVVDIESEDNDDVAVYAGKMNLTENKLFFSRNGVKAFEITRWYDRIKATGVEVKNIVPGCEFLLTLTKDDLTENVNENPFHAGLSWMRDKGYM